MTEREIFLAVLDLPDTADRSHYLDKVCDDPAQRARIEALLSSHDNAGSFLGTPAVQPPEPNGAQELGDAGAPLPKDQTLAFNAEGNAMADHKKTDDDTGDLNFLSQSTRPDSLGRLGHYEMLQVLGRGGFGIVFRAFDDTLQRVVAIKVMAPQIATLSPARRRFLREARSSAQVRHENVVQVYEVGEQPLPYLTMEFIPGETLQQRLDRTGPLDVSEILRIGRQIAEGLAAAHACDLIHRDIKPGNILLEGGSQKAKITDFGLARAADDASISQSGIIAGTPMFMAPEQALGHKIDQRADLFSLGSVLYQMASGRPPFRALSALAVLKRVAEEPPRPIPEIIPETPDWLCGIITKLHAKNPDDRFQSAREVADLLADCEAKLKAKQAVKNVLPASPSAVKPAGRKWVAAAVVLLLSVLTLVATEFAGVTHLFRSRTTPVSEQPSSGPTPIVKVDPARDLDRRAAEYVLSIGGTVGVNGLDAVIASAAGLPAEAFRLTRIDLGSYQARGAVRDAGLAYVKDCEHLTWLNLNDTHVSDAGLAHLKNCKNLTNLELVSTRVSDAGLVYVKDCKKLTRLFLIKTRVSDDGLAHLAGLNKLAELNVQSTMVTTTGLEVLAKVLPDCKITWNRGVFDLAAGIDPDRRAAEYVFSIGGYVRVEGNSHAYRHSAELPEGAFQMWQVSFEPRAEKAVTDAGLEVFADCKNMTHLNLAECRGITDAGLVHFKRFTKLVELNLSRNPITDAGLAYFADCKNLTYLWLHDTPITDAVLARLAGLDKLAELNVTKTVVTAKGVEGLAKALPKCKITWDRGVNEPSSVMPPTFKNSIGMEFVIVPKGKSRLGGSKDKLGDKEVEIPADFYLGKYEVTQEEWEKVMGENPSGYSRTGEGKDAVKDIPDADLKRFPVENVSWDQCQVFVAKLNQREKETGWVDRLPKEAEWEYACRGGPMTDKLDSAFDFYFARPTNTLLPKQANFNNGTRENPIGLNRPCKVGSYEPNALGLYDMHGNVWQWCDDTAKEADNASKRVYRGGSWDADGGRYCRAAFRYDKHPPWTQVRSVGLRLARVPSGAPAPEAKTPPVVVAPFTDADVQRIAALPAADQVEEVRKELVRLNPKFDGKVEHKIEDGVVTEIKVVTDKVTDVAPIRVFNALRVLDLNGTHLNYKGNGKLADLSPLARMNVAGLTRLNLSFTMVGDAGLVHFKDCENLTSLALDTTQVSDTGLAYFKDYTSLTYLALGSLKVSDAGLAHFKNCKSLIHLQLGGSPVGDAGLSNFKECENLTVLGLANTLVTDAGLAHFKNFKNFKKLDNLNLLGTPVSNAGMAHFKDCKVLTRLDIARTKVSDLSLIKEMPLKKLDSNFRPERDAEILRSIRTLETINGKPAAEFWQRYDKGEFKK